MIKPPKTIDDARVLYCGEFEDTKTIQSRFKKRSIEGLAICTYDNVSYYLFICDKGWKVVADSFHENVNKAMEHASHEFGEANIIWRRV